MVIKAHVICHVALWIQSFLVLLVARERSSCSFDLLTNYRLSTFENVCVGGSTVHIIKHVCWWLLTDYRQKPNLGVEGTPSATTSTHTRRGLCTMVLSFNVVFQTQYNYNANPIKFSLVIILNMCTHTNVHTHVE